MLFIIYSWWLKPQQGRVSGMLSVTLPGDFTRSQGKIQVFVERLWYRADQQKWEYEITGQMHTAPGWLLHTVPCLSPEQGPLYFPLISDSCPARELPAWPHPGHPHHWGSKGPSLQPIRVPEVAKTQWEGTELVTLPSGTHLCAASAALTSFHSNSALRPPALTLLGIFWENKKQFIVFLAQVKVVPFEDVLGKAKARYVHYNCRWVFLIFKIFLMNSTWANAASMIFHLAGVSNASNATGHCVQA